MEFEEELLEDILSVGDSPVSTEEFDTECEETADYYVLVIYDIVSNRKRTKLAKFLKGYGFRIQKSCFEAFLSKTVYNKLKAEIGAFASEEDSIRMYRLTGKGQVTNFGIQEDNQVRKVVIV